MVRLVDSEALKILELPSPPRFLGWTQHQWALAAGQFWKKYSPTPQDAFRLRMEWLNSSQTVDPLKADQGFAGELFYNLAKREAETPLMQDRANSCG